MENSTGELAPTLMPRIRGIQADNGRSPLPARACRIPTEAEEDWSIAATKHPARIPKIGFLNNTRIFPKASLSFRGPTDSEIRDMESNSKPKPKQINPTFLVVLFLLNI